MSRRKQVGGSGRGRQGGQLARQLRGRGQLQQVRDRKSEITEEAAMADVAKGRQETTQFQGGCTTLEVGPELEIY